jgi:hypothetical protein
MISLDDAAKTCGEIIALGTVVIGAVKVLFSQLKLHLREEFATKDDFRRFEKKVEYLLKRRDQASKPYNVSEERAD